MDTDTDVPGEVPYPTQPFPTKPPPFAGQGVTLEDANDLTPEVHRLASLNSKPIVSVRYSHPRVLEGLTAAES
ncbi:MAG: hypothetical protein Ct9H300mP25_04710 [Acidobacteriota bacterium]|nr:MAG: hypothetical protein Ct9H300mP25_04710 [Acidobacteriota bacterium]